MLLLVGIPVFGSGLAWWQMHRGPVHTGHLRSYACGKPDAPSVVVSTSMLHDMVSFIGGKVLCVQALMGPDTDPHYYKLTPGDLRLLQEAHLVVYNGLMLEGQLTRVFRGLAERGTPVYAVGDSLPDSLLRIADPQTGTPDPHIWFSVRAWKYASRQVAQWLSDDFPADSSHFLQRLQEYLRILDSVDRQIRLWIAELPPSRRILITSHDAFSYFGEEYGIEIATLQGVSSLDAFGLKEMQALAERIVRERIPAIFSEQTVMERSLHALLQWVEKRGVQVCLAGPLYSDACGYPGSGAETVPAMLLHNARVFVNAMQDGCDSTGAESHRGV